MPSAHRNLRKRVFAQLPLSLHKRLPLLIQLRYLLLEWRDAKKIGEGVFNKVARENAVKLLGLD